jgi:hypothetical protein
MTLVPDRNFATEFPPDQVDNYIQAFKNAAEEKYGGPVRVFDYVKHDAGNGRIYVAVTQHVT